MKKVSEEEKHILIVEDDEIVSELICEMVKELGLLPSACKSGHEAISWLRNNSPDLMILDYSLPDMNAAILISLISHEMDKTPPFVVSTGMGDEFIAVDMMKRGARDYLVKNNQFLSNLPLLIKRVLRELEIENKLYSAQNALDESQSRLRTVLDAIPDLIFFKDPHGIWLEVNQFLLDSIKLPENEVIGKTSQEIEKKSEFIHLNFHQFEQAENEVWEQKKTIRKNEVIHFDSSSKFTFDSVRIPIFHFDGSKRGLLTVSRDITEILRVENERLEIEKKMIDAQKHESLGILAGGIAHDFNNLLTVILGHTDLSLHFANPQSSVFNSLKEIESATRKAADLCQQMLAYSGKTHFIPKALNLNQLIENIQQMINISVSKRIVIEQHLSDNIRLIDGDPAMIQQIITNLLTNSAEAINTTTGKIIIETGSKFCDQEEFTHSIFPFHSDDKVFTYFKIIDNGSGIQPQNHKKIFEPFFTTRFSGRGLGLPAVLGLVKSHQGFITLKSSEDSGSEFTVYFPASLLQDELQQELIKNGIEHFTLDGFVLLIDDDEKILKTTAELLQFIGFNVLTASNGTDALDILCKMKQKIIFVILDYQIPKQNGSVIHKEISEMSNSVPVIITSGFDQDKIKDKFSDKNFFFLQKPYTLNYFSQKISEFLKRNKII